MAILYDTLAFQIRAALDAEGSDYYRDDLDIVPAINDAQDFLMGLILPKFGNKKFNAELFKGLIKTRIFQPSTYSRIYVDQVIDTWGLISVFVNPTVAIPPAAVTPYSPVSVPNPDRSAMVGNYIYVNGGAPARRMNSQEWGSNLGNPFEGSYVPQPTEVPALNLNYGYLTHTDNLSTIDPVMPYEITIRPFIGPSTPVAITFATYPTRLTGTGVGQNLDWNPVFQLMLKNAALNMIAQKQGDKTTVYEISSKQVEELIMLNG